HDLLPEEEQALRARIESHLPSAELVVFQDYNKGTLTPSLIQALLERCRSLGIPTAVDPKFRNFWAYRGATLFKPNRREVEAALGQPLPPEMEALEAAHRQLQKRLTNQLTLITLGAHGLFLGDKGGGTLHPTQPRSITDVCGAGDSVLSVAALSVAAGLELDTLARLANLAGGQVCEKVGVVPLDLEQLEREFAVLV
ncbi:MAG: carbohydrate kinase, partial [Bacteroidetes bacterium]